MEIIYEARRPLSVDVLTVVRQHTEKQQQLPASNNVDYEGKDQTTAPDVKVQKAIAGAGLALPNHEKGDNVNKPLPPVISQSLSLKSCNKRASYPRINLQRHDSSDSMPQLRDLVSGYDDSDDQLTPPQTPPKDIKDREIDSRRNNNENSSDSSDDVTIAEQFDSPATAPAVLCKHNDDVSASRMYSPAATTANATSSAEDISSAGVSDQALAVFRATRTRPPQLTMYERLVRLYQEAIKSKDFILQVQCATYILSKLSTMHTESNELAIATVKLLKKLAGPQGMTRPGHPDAQFMLGNCYGTGSHGVKVNHGKAFNCYWLASKQYHPECTYRVAVCYEMGVGTKQNFRRALEYFRKSAKMGFTPAMYKLGLILIDSSQSPDSRREGTSWLKRAIQRTPDAPDPVALHALGSAFETTGFALVPDVEFAREVFIQAAELGYAPSQYRLAVAYEAGDLDLPKNERLAVIWAQKAAFQGVADAQFLISCWHLNGTMQNVQQNSDLAYRWAKQAAENGHTRAMFALACFYEFGIGTEADLQTAEKWLHTAAANNDKLAIQRVRELKAANGASTTSSKRKEKSSCILM